jgi:hypothetical protein
MLAGTVEERRRSWLVQALYEGMQRACYPACVRKSGQANAEPDTCHESID